MEQQDRTIEWSSHDRVLQCALSAEFSWTPQPDRAIKWIAVAVGNGLTRVYAETIEENFASGPEPLRVEVAIQRIDRVVHQATTLGRREGCVHVTCARFANTVVVLSDNDQDYGWLLPAIRQRLREELAKLQLALDSEKTQSVDLARGGTLRLLGFELRLVKDKHGAKRVRYKCTDAAAKSPRKSFGPHLRLASHFRRLSFMRGYWTRRQTLTLCVALAFTLAVTGAALLFSHRTPEAPRQHGFIKRLCRGESLQKGVRYVVFVPHAYDYDGSEAYPTILFLHDYWDRGTDGYRHVQSALGPAITGRERDFEFIAVFPHSAGGMWEDDSDDLKTAVDALADVEKDFRVDKKRLYLTGKGYGAAGIWRLAAAFPDHWAAVVPVWPFGSPESPTAVKHIPCWCFEAANRGHPTKETIEALKAAGGRPRYTEMQGVGTYNRIDDRVYALPELYQWLLRHRLP
jgi:hypothetical protein